MRAPSVKKLRQFWPDQALTLRKLMTNKLDPVNPAAFPQTHQWLCQCYHRPSRIELIMSALSETLDAFGIEAIWEGYEHTSGDVIAEYVNMGDTYDTTILYSHHHDRFEVTSWGDWVEWAESKRIIKREED